MMRNLIGMLVVGAFVLASTNSAEAGWLFGSHNDCCKPAPKKCHKPAPKCHKPAPKCCAPAPTCCKPAPTCCKPAPTCCKPAPKKCSGAASGGHKAEDAPAPPPEKESAPKPDKKA